MPRRIPILLALTILWCARPLYAAPAISNVNCPASAAMYDKLEMTFDVTTVATNLYWPYDASPAANVAPHTTAVPAGVGVSVDGLFLPPGETNWNNAIVQPGFYYQDFTRNDAYIANRTWIYPNGSPCWKLRFAPTSIGTWHYKIRVTDSGGTTTSIEDSFTCAVGTNHGFVKVSTTDSRYFELSDGTYLPMVGLARDVGDGTKFESEYANLSSLGVNLIRSWWQSSIAPTALFGAGGQGGDQNWLNLVVSSAEVRPGHLVSAKLNSTGTIFCRTYVKPSRTYLFSAWVKTVALVVGTGGGFELEVELRDTEVPMTKVIGDTEWTQVFYRFTTGPTQYEANWTSICMRNYISGAAYVTDVSMREDLGGGNYGPELLMRTDFQPHTGYPQRIASTVDKQLETAAENGIYVKAVIEEVADTFFGHIQADGSYGATSTSNVYASATHACRTYQTYYWRYLIARYGYSTALHSVEFVNEGDPYNGTHWSAAKALGAYFRANDPNKHLTSTSNWHSFPPAMWSQPEVDIADLHMYMGWGVASGGKRLFAGWDGSWSTPNTNSFLEPGWEVDETEASSGHQSLKLTVAEEYKTISSLSFNCGVIPGHSYKISWMAKATNILAAQGSNNAWIWKNPGIRATLQEGEGDYAGTPSNWIVAANGTSGRWGVPNGTYNWTLVEAPTFVVPADGAKKIRVMGISLECELGNAIGTGTGYAWYDDFKVMDVTTGEVLNYNGGFEYMDSESYDVVAGHSAYSHLTHSFGFNKPTIRGEVGLTHALRFTDPYKGFHYGGEDQLLIDDIEGIWWKKWAWANIHPSGLIEIYWFYQVLLHPDYGGQYPKYGKAYQDFMADIFLSNGHYVDAGVTTVDPDLRVLGQKDLTNNKAHLWFDNAKHTWKNVVDGVAIPAVSGTVTVTGLRDGPYKVEWWNTSTGVITSTDSMQCTSGSISLVISGLATDKACKIYQDDASPPSGGISINGGTAGTTSTLVTLLLSATDADSGVSMMRFSNDSSIWSNWETYSTSKAWNITEGDGVRTVYVQYMNGGQTQSPWYNDTILSDGTQPSGTIIVNSGAAFTGSAAVTLTLAATDATSGVAQMRFSNDGATWSTWESYGTGKVWILPSDDGTRTVYAQYKDGAGTSSSPCIDSIVLDTSPPAGAITINAGAQYANSASVTVTASVSDTGSGLSEMRFSNDETTWSTWETYASSKSWSLTSDSGPRTVYAQFKDAVGNTSSSLTDAITLDTVAPTGTVDINSGAASTGSLAITLTLAATDATSGVAQMRFSNDNSTWSTWESYATSKAWTLTSGDGTKTVYVQYKDGANNASENCTDTIVLADTGPAGAITINAGDEYVKTASVTLTLSASGGVISVTEMHFSNDGTTWGEWLSYATSASWNLSSGDGTKTVYVQYKDGVGRTSTNCADTIILDTSVPTVVIAFPTSLADYYSNHPSLTVRGTAAADATGLTWATDGGASGNCSGTSSWETEEIALTEGANVITITAGDAAGNSAMESITLHRVNAHPPDTWASVMMVSIPLMPDEPDPKAALGFDSDAWYIFRPMQNNYVGYGDDSEHLTWLDPAAATLGRGFWARFLDPATTPLGEIPDQNLPATIHLYPGWNIIGTPFLSPVTWDVTRITVREVGGVQNTLANSRSVLDNYAFGWRRIQGVGAYYIVYDANIYPGIDGTLEPWMAYWIRVYRECDLTFPAPPSTP